MLFVIKDQKKEEILITHYKSRPVLSSPSLLILFLSPLVPPPPLCPHPPLLLLPLLLLPVLSLPCLD